MSAVTPACCHTHLAKSEHHVSFSSSTPRALSRPQPSALAEKPATRLEYGSQSKASLSEDGLSSTPTWLSAMLAIFWPMVVPEVGACLAAFSLVTCEELQTDAG